MGYLFPHGLKQDDDVVAMSEASEVSLLVSFDEKFGKLYSAILLTAPEKAPHLYMRSIGEMVLRAPTMKDNPIMSPTARASPKKTLSRTGGSRSSPMLLKKTSLAMSGRSLVESPTAKSLTRKSFTPESSSMDDIVELVGMLGSQQPVPPFPEPLDQATFVEPRTLGALAGLQLAILASAPAKEFPGMRDALREAGAILPLVGFLRSGQQDQVQVAVLALGYIAEGNHENAKIIKEANALPLLLKLMKHSTPAMRQAAAASLQNISGAFEGSGVVGHLSASHYLKSDATGEHELVPGVHVGNSTVPSDAGYDTVLSWLQSSGLRHKAREFQKAKLILSNPNALHMQKMLADPPKSHTEWRYMVLYNVKEGVLIYLADDRESCERVVRDIAVMYGITTHPPGRTSLVTGTSIVSERNRERHSTTAKEGFDESNTSAASIKNAAEARVKSVEVPVGKVSKGTACYKLTNIITQELGRRFAVHCDPDDQNECTNCVMFCMRVILELKLTLRGYHVRRMCDEHPHLGKKAGEAAADVFEQLWSRTGANMHAGLDSHEAKITSSRWCDALHTTKEEPTRLLHAWRGLPPKPTMRHATVGHAADFGAT